MDARQQASMDSKPDEQAAQERFTQGYLLESFTDYDRLCRQLPERLDLRARLGYLALLANELDAAVQHLAQALNQGLRSRKTLAQLAEAHYRQGRLDSAAYCYQRLGREGLAGTLHLDTHNTCGAARTDDTAHDRAGAAMWLAENQLLLTQAALPALADGVWFLDSGMTGGALAVPGTEVETLGLELYQSDALIGTGGGGTVQGAKLSADWLWLDQLCRHNLDGVMLDAFALSHSCGFEIQGLIGHDLLREAVLTLDFPAMHLYLTDAHW